MTPPAPPRTSSPPRSRPATQLDDLNKLVVEKEEALASFRIPRKDAYDGDNGLTGKMKAIKEAVRSQYGSTSPEYLQVKAIRI